MGLDEGRDKLKVREVVGKQLILALDCLLISLQLK